MLQINRLNIYLMSTCDYFNHMSPSIVAGFIVGKDDECVAKEVCKPKSCPGDHTACTIVNNKITCGCQKG